MNFIQKIIEILTSIFGAKAKKSEPKPKARVEPKPTRPPVTENPMPTPEPAPVAETPSNTLPEMTITEQVMNQSLHLGHYDKNSNSQESIQAYLNKCHGRIGLAEKKTKLRNGDTLSWVDLKGIDGDAVKTLQTFLVNIGILPEWTRIDGLFGYGTQAGVRLFQEYQRIYGNMPDLVPHGVVDVSTWKLMRNWQKNGKKASKWTRGANSPEYNKWMQILKNGQTHYLNESKSDESKLIIETIEKKIDELNNGRREPIDTRKIKDWNFDPKETHLIGVRRKEDTDGSKRKNDDLFILLINGMVFKFWGSTDPNANKLVTGRSDEAFLVEGQHKFRFGWHKKSIQNKLYQGLNPYNGVLIFRDRTSDNKLTQADVIKGIDLAYDINIHWTGEGLWDKGNYSSGCQVVAAKSYIDNFNVKQDCGKAFSANKRKTAEPGENIITTKTKGAYNMFIDLILCFRAKDVDHLYYTLGREDSLHLIDDNIMKEGERMVRDTLSDFNIPRG